MDKHYIEWLTTQRVPMFDIQHLPHGVWDGQKHTREAWEFTQKRPAKVVTFVCGIDDLAEQVKAKFPQMATPIGTVALMRAIDDLKYAAEPGWSAGSMTEELKMVVREGLLAILKGGKL